MIPSNAHTHTTFCDGSSSPREMVGAALDLGFVSLGFSAHSTLPFGLDWTLRDPEGYQAEVRALAEEYRDRIEIYCGIEWDSESEIEREAYDYAISSVHRVRTPLGAWEMDHAADEFAVGIRDGFGGDAYALCEEYFSLVAQNALREGVDMVGHFDVVNRLNIGNRFFDRNHPRYRAAALSALDTICTHRPDVIFECNMGGMARFGLAEPEPPLWILQYLHGRGMRVTVTSDAHNAGLLGAKFDEGCEILRSAGYRTVQILRHGAFTDYPI